MKKINFIFVCCLLCLLPSAVFSLDQMPDNEMKVVSLQNGMETAQMGESPKLPDLLEDEKGKTTKDLGIEIPDETNKIAGNSDINTTQKIINLDQTLNMDKQAFDYSINHYFNTSQNADVKSIRLQLSTDFYHYSDYFNK